MPHANFLLPPAPSAVCLIVSTTLTGAINCISLIGADAPSYTHYHNLLAAELEAQGGQNLMPDDHVGIHTLAENAMAMGPGTTQHANLHFHWVWTNAGKDAKPFPAKEMIKFFTNVAKKAVLPGGIKGMLNPLVGVGAIKT
jgi:hypothetical protein